MKYYIIVECEYKTLTTEDPCNLAVEEFTNKKDAIIAFEELKENDIYGEFCFNNKFKEEIDER